MKQTKIPERMCVVCRQMKPKNQLIRIVNTDDGVVVDLSGKVNGRGVYVCKCKQCVERVCKNKSFAKNYGFSLESVVGDLEKLIEQ